LYEGIIGQLFSVVSHACAYNPIDNIINGSAISISYTTLSYLLSNISTSTCTNSSIANGTQTCKYNTTTFPKQISAITHTIPQFSTTNNNTNILMTTYTYFSVLGTYLPLCSQNLLVQLLPQQLANSAVGFNTSRCLTTKTG